MKNEEGEDWEGVFHGLPWLWVPVPADQDASGSMIEGVTVGLFSPFRISATRLATTSTSTSIVIDVLSEGDNVFTILIVPDGELMPEIHFTISFAQAIWKNNNFFFLNSEIIVSSLDELRV